VNVDSSYHRQYREQTTASVASQPTVNSWSGLRNAKTS